MTHIRKATTADVEAVAILFDAYRVFYKKTSDIAMAAAFIKERLQLNESQIYVAETNDKELVGFVQCYLVFSSTRMARLWLLNDLFVEEAYRGQGISKMLIEAAKELCFETNACGLILETAKTNTVGNALYPKTGFVLDEEHNYYSWDR
jgi:ribosomal protein S18 acetylase RimI-like enzyme